MESLGTWIRQHNAFPLKRALSIGLKIAGALKNGHRVGIAHQDVKPGNILLTDYGEPALTDLGVAHVTGGFQTSAGTLTEAPAVTVPEVLEVETPTPAADAYRLSATFFCALAGRAAF